METKIGPAFSHLGYNYRGEEHAYTNMIIDGQKFPDVFIGVGEKPMTMLIDNKPPSAKCYLGFVSDQLVIAYNSKSHFTAYFEKQKQDPYRGIKYLLNQRSNSYDQIHC